MNDDYVMETQADPVPEDFRIPEPERSQWLTALESGKYNQYIGGLWCIKTSDTAERHCCLAVEAVVNYGAKPVSDGIFQSTLALCVDNTQVGGYGWDKSVLPYWLRALCARLNDRGVPERTVLENIPLCKRPAVPRKYYNEDGTNNPDIIDPWDFKMIADYVRKNW